MQCSAVQCSGCDGPSSKYEYLIGQRKVTGIIRHDALQPRIAGMKTLNTDNPEMHRLSPDIIELESCKNSLVSDNSLYLVAHFGPLWLFTASWFG